MSVALITFELNGVEWSRFRDQFCEWYSHVDLAGRHWKLWRQHKEYAHDKLQQPWTASLLWEDPEEGPREKELNGSHLEGNNLCDKGDLYHLGAHDPVVLLEGMSKLIMDAA